MFCFQVDPANSPLVENQPTRQEVRSMPDGEIPNPIFKSTAAVSKEQVGSIKIKN